jgi:hypothetical protein
MLERYAVQWYCQGGNVFASHWQTLKRGNSGGLAVSEDIEEARRMYGVAKTSFEAEDSLRLIKVTTEVVESVGPEAQPELAGSEAVLDRYAVGERQLTELEEAIAVSDVALEDVLPPDVPQHYSHDFGLTFNVGKSVYETAEECLEHELSKVLSALRERCREAEECPLEVLEEVNSFPE